MSILVVTSKSTSDTHDLEKLGVKIIYINLRNLSLFKMFEGSGKY